MTKETRIADPPLITADQLAQWELEIKAYLEHLKSLTHITDYRITKLPDGSISAEVPAIYFLTREQLAELSRLTRGRATLWITSPGYRTRLAIHSN